MNHFVDGLVEEDDETKYVSVGFDKTGNLLEIMYNHIDDQTIKVFHAMKCRKQFREALEIQEKIALKQQAKLRRKLSAKWYARK